VVAESTPSPTALVRRARRINRELGRLHPEAHIELNFVCLLELLVAAILSAQTTDRKVNEVTRVLFARYRTARSCLRNAGGLARLGAGNAVDRSSEPMLDVCDQHAR
jgi:hypothetical protein